MTALPPLSVALSNPETLSATLGLLFESSPILEEYAVPALMNSPPDSYETLIDRTPGLLPADAATRIEFVGAHPRIGQRKGLSAASHAEQRAGSSEDEQVLTKLEELNARYERRYPGMRYITFVDGRSRAEIALEMETKLSSETGQDSLNIDCPQWSSELERALRDVVLIAHSRLKRLQEVAG